MTRRSGRTTRALKQCVQQAREGKQVMYVVHRMAFVPYCVGLMIHAGVVDPEEIGGASRTIVHVREGGSIRFVSDASARAGQLQGYRQGSVFVDHFLL